MSPATPRRAARSPTTVQDASRDAPLPASLLQKASMCCGPGCSRAQFNRFIGNVSGQSVAYTDSETGQTTPPLLKFDASFESGAKLLRCRRTDRGAGNMGKVEAVSPFEFELYIRADVANPK